MKQGIHPSNWQHDCVVTCSCGNTFVTGGSKKTMQVDICNACHPFFTGEMRFVDRQGRVDKFQKKMQMAAQAAAVNASKAKKAVKEKVENKSYKQILIEQQNELKAKQAETVTKN
ncbi:MAG TPA: 50S ribosomal protein L31 [Candidatus Woesebacteria bacterium]|nr:50S ribosomal protein L31 [Candidatus Woesebacteria bacterium]